jgi:hypothetical protein
MKKKMPKLVLFALPCLVLLSNLSYGDESELKMPPKKNFCLILLAGQSNMAGRGIIGEEDLVAPPRVLALSQDREWVPAVAPIHFDKSVAGVGLAKSFAIALAEANPDITIGLIPAACGGSPIATWEPGGYHVQTHSPPYDDAISRVRTAMNDGVLKGILWHQGESDCKPDKAKGYEKKLRLLFERFRKEFDFQELPIVIGQLSQFPGQDWSSDKIIVDKAHRSIAQDLSNVTFATSEGLTPNEDRVHFDSRSLRIFGKRYAEAYVEATIVDRRFKSTARRSTGKSAKGRKIED